MNQSRSQLARILSVALCLWLAAQPLAWAGTITVMTSGGFRDALDRLLPAYEKKSGNKVIIVQGPSMGLDATAIPNRLARGEVGDVAIMVRSALDGLVASGRVTPNNVTDLAQSEIAMAVKAGAPKPEIASVADFKRVLLKAKSVAYSDSASGVYIRNTLFKRLGIEKTMAPKSTMIQATPVGLLIAKGDYEIGFQQLSELKPIPGIEIVGVIPANVQLITTFSAGLLAKSPDPSDARDLVRFLTSSAAASEIRESGMDPAPASR